MLRLNSGREEMRASRERVAGGKGRAGRPLCAAAEAHRRPETMRAAAVALAVRSEVSVRAAGGLPRV
jgi:hypothetical protein